MDKPKLIKSIMETPCPHCGHILFVCTGFLPPGISWIIPEEEMAVNKQKLKDLLELVEFASKDEKKRTFEWVESPDCVLGSEDVESVCKLIIQEQKDLK